MASKSTTFAPSGNRGDPIGSTPFTAPVAASVGQVATEDEAACGPNDSGGLTGEVRTRSPPLESPFFGSLAGSFGLLSVLRLALRAAQRAACLVSRVEPANIGFLGGGAFNGGHFFS